MEEELEALANALDSSACRKIMREWGLRAQKGNEVSEFVRKKANEVFTAREHTATSHEAAWSQYTLSIAAAESNSEALAIAYGNRSAVLIHLGKFEACAADIDRALKITRNNSLKIKLLCRKAKCLSMMKSQENKKVLQEAESLLTTIADAANRKLLEDMVSKTRLTFNQRIQVKPPFENKTPELLKALHKRNKIGDFSLVRIERNDKYGRYLVASRDIKPGEVIFLEKPYTNIIDGLKTHAYCAHCLKTTWTNMPCDYCSFIMFCSEECKQEAWEQYHDVECTVYVYAQTEDDHDIQKRMAIRLLILGIREAGGVEELQAELEAFDQDPDHSKGFMKDGKIQSLGFKSIYALSKNVPIKSEEKHFDNAFLVLRGITRLASFFGESYTFRDGKSIRENETAIFLGALLLRLSKIIQLNSHDMWSGNCMWDHGVKAGVSSKNNGYSKGLYIAPITSLLNHNCDPNAKICYTDDHTVIVYAKQPIKRGEQIFIPYGDEFYEEEIASRRKKLYRKYNLKCDCLACQEEWPDLVTLCSMNGPQSGKPMSVIEQQLLSFKGMAAYTLKDIPCLSKGIIKGLKNLPRPNFVTTNLVICMATIFEKSYGIALKIPEECLNI